MIASSTTAPKGDHQPGERHRVDGGAAPVEDEHRRHQRERDRQQADRRDPPLVEERRAGSRRTSRNPSSSAMLRLWIEVLMKFDWRKIVVSNVIPGRPGLQRVDHLVHVAGDIERVAPRQLLDDEQQAGTVVDDRVADQRLVVDLDVGHLRRCGTRAPVLLSTVTRARSAGVTIGRTCRIPIRWSGSLDGAAGADDRAVGEAQQPGVHRVAGGFHDAVEGDLVLPASASGRPAPSSSAGARPTWRRWRRLRCA